MTTRQPTTPRVGSSIRIYNDILKHRMIQNSLNESFHSFCQMLDSQDVERDPVLRVDDYIRQVTEWWNPFFENTNNRSLVKNKNQVGFLIMPFCLSMCKEIKQTNTDDIVMILCATMFPYVILLSLVSYMTELESESLFLSLEETMLGDITLLPFEIMTKTTSVNTKKFVVPMAELMNRTFALLLKKVYVNVERIVHAFKIVYIALFKMKHKIPFDSFFTPPLSMIGPSNETDDDWFEQKYEYLNGKSNAQLYFRLLVQPIHRLQVSMEYGYEGIRSTRKIWYGNVLPLLVRRLNDLQVRNATSIAETPVPSYIDFFLNTYLPKFLEKMTNTPITIVEPYRDFMPFYIDISKEEPIILENVKTVFIDRLRKYNYPMEITSPQYHNDIYDYFIDLVTKEQSVDPSEITMDTLHNYVVNIIEKICTKLTHEDLKFILNQVPTFERVTNSYREAQKKEHLLTSSDKKKQIKKVKKEIRKHAEKYNMFKEVIKYGFANKVRDQMLSMWHSERKVILKDYFLQKSEDDEVHNKVIDIYNSTDSMIYLESILKESKIFVTSRNHFHDLIHVISLVRFHDPRSGIAKEIQIFTSGQVIKRHVRVDIASQLADYISAALRGDLRNIHLWKKSLFVSVHDIPAQFQTYQTLFSNSKSSNMLPDDVTMTFKHLQSNTYKKLIHSTLNIPMYVSILRTFLRQSRSMNYTRINILSVEHNWNIEQIRYDCVLDTLYTFSSLEGFLKMKTHTLDKKGSLLEWSSIMDPIVEELLWYFNEINTFSPVDINSLPPDGQAQAHTPPISIVYNVQSMEFTYLTTLFQFVCMRFFSTKKGAEYFMKKEIRDIFFHYSTNPKRRIMYFLYKYGVFSLYDQICYPSFSMENLPPISRIKIPDTRGFVDLQSFNDKSAHELNIMFQGFTHKSRDLFLSSNSIASIPSDKLERTEYIYYRSNKDVLINLLSVKWQSHHCIASYLDKTKNIISGVYYDGIEKDHRTIHYYGKYENFFDRFYVNNNVYYRRNMFFIEETPLIFDPLKRILECIHPFIEETQHNQLISEIEALRDAAKDTYGKEYFKRLQEFVEPLQYKGRK